MDGIDTPGADAHCQRLARAEARVRALHRELVETGHELEALRRRTRDAEARERNASEQLTELIRRLELAEAIIAEPERLQTCAQVVEAAAADLREQADAAQALLVATRSSWSWRLTAPVRMAGHGARLIWRGARRAGGDPAIPTSGAAPQRPINDTGQA